MPYMLIIFPSPPPHKKITGNNHQLKTDLPPPTNHQQRTQVSQAAINLPRSCSSKQTCERKGLYHRPFPSVVEWNQCLPVWAPRRFGAKPIRIFKADFFGEKFRHAMNSSRKGCQKLQESEITVPCTTCTHWTSGSWQYPAIELIVLQVSKTTLMFQRGFLKVFLRYTTGLRQAPI